MMLDLLELVNHYKACFVGKICQVSTNYKGLEQFEVTFAGTDLHHLFGLHKVTRDYASQTLTSIENGKLTLSDFKQKRAFQEVCQRVQLYPFLSAVFYKRSVEYCVVRKDLAPNMMDLDIVFFSGNSRTVTVLGLRRAKDGYYKPTTLHQSSAKRYAKVRQTKIVCISWL